jgi:hypothetical protein
MTECALPDFYDMAEPVARKSHRCCECSAPILKGEKHFHGWGKWEGVISSYRQHLACMEACMLIRDKFNGGECIGFGDLKEAFSEFRPEMRGDQKRKEPWKQLRDLIARILWRERGGKP